MKIMHHNTSVVLALEIFTTLTTHNGSLTIMLKFTQGIRKKYKLNKPVYIKNKPVHFFAISQQNIKDYIKK